MIIKLVLFYGFWFVHSFHVFLSKEVPLACAESLSMNKRSKFRQRSLIYLIIFALFVVVLFESVLLAEFMYKFALACHLRVIAGDSGLSSVMYFCDVFSTLIISLAC